MKHINEAKQILEGKVDKLHIMAEALIKYETIDEKQIKEIMSGQTPSPPADWTSEEAAAAIKAAATQKEAGKRMPADFETSE